MFSMGHKDYEPWEIAPNSTSTALGIGLGELRYDIFPGQSLEINIDLRMSHDVVAAQLPRGSGALEWSL